MSSWSNTDTCWYKYETITKPIALFDFDNTLVELRSSKPKYGDVIISKLKELSKTYDMCVFSNQMGIEKGKATHSVIQGYMTNFQKKLEKVGISISFSYATSDDIYRKPMIGQLQVLRNLTQSPIVFYCGDAAGRKSDFSVSDLFFANNAGIPFKTPEQIFLDHEEPTNLMTKKAKSFGLYIGDKWENGNLQNPRNVIPITSEIPSIELSSEKRNLIIMVGPQGSGKSSVSRYLEANKNYKIINRDRLKTKMNRIFKQYVSDTSINGIIIDNTNPQKVTRQGWISKLPNKNNWNIIIIHFNIDKLVSFHLTRYRMFFGEDKMPSIAIHIFYKKLESPSSDEGTIITINHAISNKPFNQNLRFSWR